MNERTWKSLNDLQEPFNDAVNYKTRKQREFFNKIFLRTDDLTGCLQPSVYFLIGEKGSGKTAYAAYLETNELNSYRCKLTTMTESQYKRFIELKREAGRDSTFIRRSVDRETAHSKQRDCACC
ncbi:hypothetical protein LMG9673_04731 [Ralstonia pseudosolanacearum]|uniref:hypothetical protein n=1 Tax=Ralstonia pseudosolanacearum TaxID=1310165 RepID=UPI001EBF208F|nr:hypothetical protein [Ralstonia pseudosolanacearum]CAH0445938.1 hypothetical protein LMG9673_04731 [Ralstonia pseudosolanacearum]